MEPRDNHQGKTYEDLSKEFRELFPTAIYAFQLIPYMYTRLTSVDGLSHKAAVTKIISDHEDLEGFSRTNVYRALPKDNPNIPHRVVPSRDKSSAAKLNHGAELSSTKSSYTRHAEEQAEIKPAINGITSTNSQCSDCLVKMGKIEELEKALQASSRLMTDQTVPVNWQREFPIAMPFRELKLYLIRQKNDSGEDEPVMIYITIDLKSNKVSYTLGKKPELN